MYVKKGNDRFVVIFPRLGFVLKFAMFHPYQAWQYFFDDVKHFRTRNILERFTWNHHVYGGYQRLLLKGLISNWIEFWYFLRRRKKVLQPTYFSLFFINVQKYGKPCPIADDVLWHKFVTVLGNNVFDCAHHFDEPENFCIDGLEVKMCDYGDERLVSLLNRHGEEIFAILN